MSKAYSYTSMKKELDKLGFKHDNGEWIYEVNKNIRIMFGQSKRNSFRIMSDGVVYDTWVSAKNETIDSLLEKIDRKINGFQIGRAAQAKQIIPQAR